MPRSKARPRLAASASIASNARSSTSEGATSARSRLKRWASSRARSSRSATRLSRRDASPSIAASERGMSASGTTPSASAAAWPRMAVRGVRRSWVTRIRNSRVSPSRSASRRTIRLKSDASSSSSWVPVGPSSVRRSPAATRWVAVCIAVSGRMMRPGQQQRQQQGHAQPDAGRADDPRAPGRARPMPARPAAWRAGSPRRSRCRAAPGRPTPRRAAAPGPRVKSMRWTPSRSRRP